ncbi:MAG TPA: cytochrome c [Gammaproteobacteria bacterium]|nr:cytochrome c [Gammaproteobacteria bacterium]
MIPLLAMTQASLAGPSGARQLELRHLLIQDCGSCHGMTLKGGLGPALRPANLEGKPDELLINTILHGRPGTAMPPWQALLSEEDAVWLVETLRAGVKHE